MVMEIRNWVGIERNAEKG